MICGIKIGVSGFCDLKDILWHYFNGSTNKESSGTLDIYDYINTCVLCDRKHNEKIGNLLYLFSYFIKNIFEYSIHFILHQIDLILYFTPVSGIRV
jgi:hypothetical protein